MKTPEWLTRSVVQWIGMLAGPTLALLVYLVLPASYPGSTGQVVAFTHAGRATAALAAWMAVWWMTEAISIFATALLPLALLPAVGAAPIRRAAAPYAHELVFLFMGGFILALAMQRWGLHRRCALLVLRGVGARPRRVVGGFMGVTAFLSMWVSNTATAIMMLPIATSVMHLVVKQQAEASEETERENEAGAHFKLCLLLGVAYAASIGGIGTLIGTPPNLFLASYIERNLGQEISFVRWMGIGVPVVVVFLPVAWLLLTRVLYPIRIPRIEGGTALTREAYRRLGPMNPGERATGLVFSMAAAAWLFRPLLTRFALGGVHPLHGLSDPGIAMTAALALFVIPVDRARRVFVMDWETAAKLPWGLLLLFGGGLSLAAAIQANGVGRFLGHQVSAFAGWPSLLLVVIVITLMIFLTELTSNTATTATLIPILAGLAPGLGVHPFLLIVPAAIAASCAFMLPVATPPNAVVFSTGDVTIPQMCRAGLWLNLIGIVIITALTYTAVAVILGLNPASGGG